MPFDLSEQDGLFIEGDPRAPILVISEPPEEGAFNANMTMTRQERNFFLMVAKEYGFSPEDFAYLPCSYPMDDSIIGDKAEADHINIDRDDFLGLLSQCQPRLVIVLGRHALRQVTGRAAKVGKMRGQVHKLHGIKAPVLPLFGVRQCLWFPENINLFSSDFNMAAVLDDNDYDMECLQRATAENTDYKWTLDIKELIDRDPRWLAVDTETTGLEWTDPNVRVLTVQLTAKTGESFVIPVHPKAAALVYPDVPSRELKRKLAIVRGQIRGLLTSHRVRKVGANFKFDQHQIRESLGYEVVNWFADTQQLAFAVDENMFEKSLDEVTRRWVPEMAGYADQFNATVDKSDMLGLLERDPDKFLLYAGGDTDANFRAARVLLRLLQQDEAQWQTYLKIQLPALQAFGNKIETTGMVVDRDRLGELEIQIEEETRNVHTRVISQMAPELRRSHLKDGLSLTRGRLVIDALFTDKGLGLEPMVFTPGTRKLAHENRIPSTSAKTHLVYFAHEPMVEAIMRWSKLEKMRTTYVGKEWDEEKGMPTGFWRHTILRNGLWRIYPSFFLHRTATGRSASANPNAQNFPKRGDLAKAFRSIFIAPPGWSIIEADLSQAELRIAACEANETEMIRLYNEGVDIHMNTAAMTSGNPVALFIANKGSDDLIIERANEFRGSGDYLRKLNPGSRKTATVADYIAQLRYQAKAINFGFLYGMQAAGFKTYAKIEYGVEFTDAEAQVIRDNFFEAYPGLREWHFSVERHVYEHGTIRAMHGALRRLPSIYSTKANVRSEAVRQAINSPVQRFASDLGIMSLWRMCRDCPEYVKPLAFIHDALVLYVKDEYLEEVQSAVKWYMESNPLREWFNVDLPLPIIADVSVGKRLSEMEELSGVVAIRPEWHNQEADDLGVYDMAA